MPVVRCPHCRAELEVEDAHLGTEVRCGACDATFVARADDRPPRPDDGADRPSRRPPRYDDYQEEDDRPSRRRRDDDEEGDYDRPRRRHRDGVDWEEADRLVRGPATALQVTGWIGVGLSVLNFIAVPIQLILAANAGPGQPDQAEALVDAVSGVIGGAVGLAVSILVLMGAARMKRLESYPFAMTAAILAMLPCLSPCCILGLPFGIWAITALSNAEVKEAFAANRPPVD